MTDQTHKSVIEESTDAKPQVVSYVGVSRIFASSSGRQKPIIPN